MLSHIYLRSRALFAVFAVLAAAFVLLIRQSDANRPAPTLKSQESLLQDFVKSCIAIAPGTDVFPGQFQMGGHFASPFAIAERVVEMKKPFRISRFEMTQELYAAVTGANPSRWKGPRNSVESMNWLQAEACCSKLTAMLRSAKLIQKDEVVRLPTESEWEYCCRAGSSTRYSFGDAATIATDEGPVASVLNGYAWHTGNAAGNDPAVGVLKPNTWGLYDMHGYLWEYVADSYDATRVADSDQAGATVRVIRGGSWRDHFTMLSSGARLPIPDHTSSDAIGFRCVIAAE